MRFYTQNVIKALQHVYPELEFDKTKFVFLNRITNQPLPSSYPNNHTASYWLNMENRREFFESFAKEKAFNPLVASNWHSVDFKALMTHKVCSVSYFKCSKCCRVVRLYSNPALVLQRS
jgi:hypothetical protein